MFPARPLVSDTNRSSIMVSSGMLSCRTWSVVSLPIALCVAFALCIPVALCVAVALCVPVPISVLACGALWPGLSLGPRSAPDSQ